MQYVQIPRERVGVLIGEEGSTKKRVEERTRTKLTLDDSSVTIEGEPLDEWMAVDVVKAVGRGFSPDKALLLIQENMYLEILPLPDVVGGSSKQYLRLKGRVIGREGKVRKKLEEFTGCFVSVYGKTVSIIGSVDDVGIAREAVLKLLSGSPHSTVFRFLERSQSLRKIG